MQNVTWTFFIVSNLIYSFVIFQYLYLVLLMNDEYKS